ncbi:MAG: S1C family serine protease [Christensenellales bacterium]
MMKQKRILSLVALTLVLVLALGAGISATATGSVSQDEIKKIVETTTDQSKIQSPLLEVAKTAKESVVGVNNYKVSRSSNPFSYSFGFGFDFGYRSPQPYDNTPRLSGTGSGVVVSPYGHVLTNHHVVEDSEKITITYDSKELDATLVTSDKDLDLAVLLVPGLELPAAPLGDSDALQIGEYAIVIGNPLGTRFERSVTLGVVSSVARTFTSSGRDRFGLRTNQENQMIQVDAAISSGNSGGGMFNTLGQLQGVPTLKFDSNIFSQTSIDNIGMCVPINVAKPLIKTALEKYDADAVADAAAQNKAAADKAEKAANPNTPRMGVRIFTLPASYLPVAQGILPQGAYVSEVDAKSPAEAAGMLPGDIIVEAVGEVIQSADQLVNLIAKQKADDTVSVKVYRVAGLADVLEDAQKIEKLEKGEYIDLSVTLRIMENAASN